MIINVQSKALSASKTFYVLMFSNSLFMDLTLYFGKIPVLPVLSALKINKHRVLTIFFVNLHSINCAKLNVT